MEGNLIDSLKWTGGYSKEIKRRQNNKIIAYAKKLEEELCDATINDGPSQTKD